MYYDIKVLTKHKTLNQDRDIVPLKGAATGSSKNSLGGRWSGGRMREGWMEGQATEVEGGLGNRN